MYNNIMEICQIISHKKLFLEDFHFHVNSSSGISSFPKHSHDFFEISYIYQGQGYQTINIIQ